MRVAAIDIGTNSIHMLVVRVREDLSFEVIDREKAMVRLGAGGLDGRALTADAMHAALQALGSTGWPRRARWTPCWPRPPAPREARNGGEFLARIEQETGIRRVITGQDEPASSTRRPSRDVGGGPRRGHRSAAAASSHAQCGQQHSARPQHSWASSV
jgi:hypothetical protein